MEPSPSNLKHYYERRKKRLEALHRAEAYFRLQNDEASLEMVQIVQDVIYDIYHDDLKVAKAKYLNLFEKISGDPSYPYSISSWADDEADDLY